VASVVLGRIDGSGGAGATFAIVESSSGASSAAATNAAIVSGDAGSISMPPVTTSTGCRR